MIKKKNILKQLSTYITVNNKLSYDVYGLITPNYLAINKYIKQCCTLKVRNLNKIIYPA